MPLIIPIFVVHQGCPHRCAYCNEEKAGGGGAYPPRITETSLRETVYSYLRNSRGNKGSVQIAFYGGNFTGMDRGYQEELLRMAGTFIRQGLVESIRISTRPDYIDEERLDFLEGFSVKTVEVGAQSLVDEVLRLSRRGHSSAHVRRTVALLKRRGFETGVHLMVGLPGDSAEGFAYSVDETIALHPHTVRIHPTIVFPGTELAQAYYRGEYIPLSMAEAVRVCKYALGKFTTAGIPVIRLGLQTTPEMEKTGGIVAGPFHPAFRSLVEESIFFDMASFLLSRINVKDREVTFYVSPRDSSSLRGRKNSNLKAIKGESGLTEIHVLEDHEQPRGALTVEMDGEKRHITREEFFPLQGGQTCLNRDS